jgi:transcriptional regulator with XRE-family HTH domain
MADNRRVQELVQTRRKAVGIRTQQQLADLVGVDRSHIAKIENGTIALPQPDLRRRLADVLGLSEKDFLVAAGVLEEDSAKYEVAPAPEEQRLRLLLRDLPPEDRTLLVDLAELLVRRHRSRRT